jgi:hypothetical protein
MRRLALVVAVACAGCGGKVTGPRDTGLDLLALTKLEPQLVLPGTRMVATGRSFVDETLGQSRLRLRGTLDGAAIDVVEDLRFETTGVMALEHDGSLVADGDFTGEALVEVVSTVDGRTYASPPLAVTLTFASEVTPRIDSVGDGLSFVNQPIEVFGGPFLLGGSEGSTVAILSGCFKPEGMTTCGPQKRVEIDAAPFATYDRGHLVFPYVTAISGIGPGTFQGQLQLENRPMGGGAARASTQRTVRFDIQRPVILSASTTAASLGQYVIIRGGGFVGGAADESTTLELVGQFTPSGGGAARAIDVALVPEWRSGPEVRYVLDDKDPLGMLVDLRRESGTITAMVRPVVEKGATRVDGTAIPVLLTILSVKQVVHVKFLPSFVSSLRRFGLRAADSLIRARVLEVAARDYEGANVEFRESEPDDFALYATVEISGPDPNGLGLLGYDNTPGKDVGNERLYDRIGGVNARTQQDGFPGFGGVFTESFFGFSQHPNGLAQKLEQSSTLFDAIFDPFRPDVGGTELTATELANRTPPRLSNGQGCPSTERTQQIACAIFVLGNLIGTTMTHEVGHSLGLANPYGEGFHDPGDGRARLMDAGGDRPFPERAELEGEGPAVFCDEEFAYLRDILPSAFEPPAVSRPSCN